MASRWRQNVADMMVYPDPIRLIARLLADQKTAVAAVTPDYPPGYFIYNEGAFPGDWGPVAFYPIPEEHPSFPYGHAVEPD